MKTIQGKSREEIELGLLDFRLRAKAQAHGIQRVVVAVYVINASGLLLLQKTNQEGNSEGHEFPVGVVRARETLMRAAKRVVRENLGLQLKEIKNIALGFDSIDSLGRSNRCFLVCGHLSQFFTPLNARLIPTEHRSSLLVSNPLEVRDLCLNRDVELMIRRILANKEVVTTFLHE